THSAEAKEFVLSAAGKNFKVLKADGLAAGKGVIVAKSTDELIEGITDILDKKKFGDAGNQILLEELLTGPEVSIIALTDGKTILPFPASQDHKRIFDHDEGPNTGGMGAYSPTPFYDSSTRLVVEKEIIERFVSGIQNENLDFRGIIYFGIMLTPKGPKVLEFNVRLGDPETQVILPLVKSDLYETFLATAKGELSKAHFQLFSGAACTVVLASGGYPGNFEKGFEIIGLDKVKNKKNVTVYHAGTKNLNGQILTDGGRVLAVTGWGKSLESAVVKTYQTIKKISFKNMQFRKDIAGKALKNKRISKRIMKNKVLSRRKSAGLVR
ncbi:MAG: phosphoribosylamine--glycine ligase, partial [Elusimicrobiota bacterium]